MEVKLNIDGLQDLIAQAVESAMRSKQAEHSNWPYYSAEEAAEKLQITVKHLLDKRYPFINEIEYAQHGKRIFWFKKESVFNFIEKRMIVKYHGRVPEKMQTKLRALKAS